mgnify:CR=1 FL=1
MIKKTTIKLDIEINEDNTSSKKIEYKNYSKNIDNEEDLLTYKNVIKYDAEGKKFYNTETFNKIKKVDDIVDEEIILPVASVTTAEVGVIVLLTLESISASV